MTKKDFILMAGKFAEVITKDNKSAILALIGTFCQIAERNNSNFDEKKFKLACGL